MTRDALKHYIQSHLLAGADVGTDENLLLTGRLDSLSVMALVAHIESETGHPIPPQDVIFENFETIDAIAGYLDSRP